MDKRDMALRVREAVEKGMHVELSVGSDAQILGQFLDVRIKLNKDGIGGEYLGWCSLDRRKELERIIREYRPNGWRKRISAQPKDDSIATEIAMILQRCSRLEADRLQMEPEHVGRELSHLRRTLEMLFERVQLSS